MSLDENKKIEIKSSTATIIALLLLAVYFLNDFLEDGRFVVARIYVIIIGFSIYFCAKKVYFYKCIYNFLILVILGELLKCSIPYFTNPKWFYNSISRRFEFSKTSYIKMVFSTPYLYIYLIGIILFVICKFAPSLCDSYALKHVFNTLGIHSIWAIIVHMYAVCFSEYELLRNVIFLVFIVSAFWTAYTKEKLKTSNMLKAVLLVAEISVFIQLYSKQCVVFLEKIWGIQNVSWYYSIGIYLICAICIFSEQSMQDTMVGFIILGTNLLFLFEKFKQVTFEPKMILIFHIMAVSFYYFLKSIFGFEKDNKMKRYLKLLYVCCYIVAFLFTIFEQYHYTKSIILLGVGVLVLLIYFGKFVNMKGTIYGTIIFGVVPWSLLETTLASIGKLHSSLSSVILFTVMFWCICGVVLSWKDSTNIKAIAFEQTNSERIINGMSLVAYFLTAIMLFL